MAVTKPKPPRYTAECWETFDHEKTWRVRGEFFSFDVDSQDKADFLTRNLNNSDFLSGFVFGLLCAAKGKIKWPE